MTSWDEPYMGEESIMRPPASKNRRITDAQASRAIGSLPTLNVIQLPSPTRGTLSPLEGIGLVLTVAGDCAATSGVRSHAVNPSVPRRPRKRRRDNLDGLFTGNAPPRHPIVVHDRYFDGKAFWRRYKPLGGCGTPHPRPAVLGRCHRRRRDPRAFAPGGPSKKPNAPRRPIARPHAGQRPGRASWAGGHRTPGRSGSAW